MLKRFAAIAFFGIAVPNLSCAPRKIASTDSFVASTSKGLPIIGTWVVESYDGYFYKSQNALIKVKLARDELRPTDWQLVSKIDSDGNGYLTTKIDCKPNASRPKSEHSGIRVPPGFDLFPNPLKLRSCDGGNTVVSQDTRITMGIRRSAIPANLGLDGNKNSLLKECDSLRGCRYIQTQTSYNYLKLAVAGSMGCIGFSDAGATKLSLLVVPVNEVRAIKVDFSRIR